MSLGALVFFFLATSSRKYVWVKWVGFCLCVSLLLLSTAKTALIVFVVTMAVIPLYKALRWNQTFALAFFIVLILVGGAMATLFLNNAETILGTFGRDTTLTGRTLLWPAVLYKIWQRPWLGYGYGGFWLGWDGESADVWRIVRWEVPHAHNGFLDVWLNIGLLGLLAFALSFLATWLQALSWARRTKTAEGLWPFAYLTFLILTNLGESTFFRLQSIWVLYVALTLSMQNMNENLAASKPSSQQKVKKGTSKQIMQNSHEGRG
jgi:O-antigen ligase